MDATVTVLIVDDEEPIRAFLVSFLREAGFHTIEAINGAQALTMVATERPDLILSDIMMPVLNGVEFCRQMKSLPATRLVPVILMSSAGYASANGSGADAFIAKPFDSLDDVENLIRRWSPPGKSTTTRPTPP